MDSPPAHSRHPAQEGDAPTCETQRLNTRDLFGQARAVQIEHEGKVYELRLTKLNKLILTA